MQASERGLPAALAYAADARLSRTEELESKGGRGQVFPTSFLPLKR